MYQKIMREKAPETDNKISAVHLSKTYFLKERSGLLRPKREKIIHAVKDITLEIPCGKITGILGINGAGKTTTIRMLASMIAPTSGSLTMNGIDAVKNHRWVKERINVISGGERNLYWRLTAKENLYYFGSLYGLSGKYLKERTAQLLKQVGLEEAADTPVERYSKGMKQRLQIARGLINDPEYLFLDEPTLGLDIMIAKEIRLLISLLARKENKGVLLTTHYIREAEELCDYIYILDKGEIIAQGTKEALKEFFQKKPQLIIQTAPSAFPFCQIITDTLDETACAQLENGVLQLSGDTDSWINTLTLLARHRIPITDLHIEEPGLEEVLMQIIHQARGEEYEKNNTHYER